MSNPNIPADLKKFMDESKIPLKTPADLAAQAAAKEVELRKSVSEFEAKVSAQLGGPPANPETTKPAGMTTESLMDIVGKPPAQDTNIRPAAVTSVAADQLKFDPSKLNEALIGTGILQAKALNMPEMLNLKPRDPSKIFRWVNFKTEEGRRVSMHKALGFEIAQSEDVDSVLPMDVKQDAIGITSYDVVLMKIDKLTLLQAYEYNLQKSHKMVNQKTAHDQALTRAVEQLRSDMVANNIPSDYLKGKVNYFTPSAEQAEALNR